jgi:3-methyl-2-oxobutanoate hydroxymethyltransferase
VKVSLPELRQMKAEGRPIVMITAYDHPSGRIVDAAGVDLVLVGDSGAMTVLGYPSTVPVSTDEMVMLAAAVRRGLRSPLLIGDLPFGSYEASDEQAIATARLLATKEGICGGFSAGANVAAALRVAAGAPAGALIVTLAPDTGLKYLSTDLFD